MDDNVNQVQSKEKIKSDHSQNNKDLFKNSKILTKFNVVEKAISWENIKLSAIKMLIPILYYLCKFEIIKKHLTALDVDVSVLKLNNFKHVYPIILSIEIAYFLKNLGEMNESNKKFFFKEIGKRIIYSAICLFGSIGLSYLFKRSYEINGILPTIFVEIFSIFTINSALETSIDHFFGSKTKEEIYFNKIQNSDYTYSNALKCFGVDKNVDEHTLNRLKSEIFNAFNPDRFINPDLKIKAKRKLEKYQAAYEIIKSRI